MRVLFVLGWIAVAISVLVMLVFGLFRIGATFQPSVDSSDFGVRYVQHPVVGLLHMIPGLLYLTLAPLQFIARIRNRHINFHRRFGRILVTLAIISGVYALIVNFVLPVFGGVVTQTATVFWGVIFLFAIAKALFYIKHHDVVRHREWMLRVFGLAMGVATIRFLLMLFEMSGSIPIEQSFGIAFWLGFGINLTLAEIWIRKTR